MPAQNITEQKGFIALDRRFRDIGEMDDVEESASRSYLALLGGDPGLGWETVLKSRIAVILGEPGSGKTWELRNRAAVLREKGVMSFYVHLDRLVNESLSEAIRPEYEPDFLRWKRRDGHAVLFLDSVDEAKIQRQNDFAKALDNLVRGIGSQRIQFVNLVVSSRISDWRVQTDKDDLLNSFSIIDDHRGIKSKSDDGVPAFRVVQLEPLDEKRVSKFAEGMGLQDYEKFLAELDNHHAWEFARRPIDIVNLIEYWHEHGRLGSLTELIEFDLNKRLRETEDRSQNDPLTPDQVFIGAKALGATVVFCKRFNFIVSDRPNLQGDVTAMDPRDCLPSDWTHLMCQRILSRALFDSASYGRIRFHHRRIAEYLAAQWLRDRMHEGCPYPVLEDLLISNHNNQWVVKPSLRPVVAWLSLGDEPWVKRIRQQVRSFAPDLFFTQGDAESLPMDFKHELFKSLIERYRDRDRIYWDADVEALSRFSDNHLAPGINEVLNDIKAPQDVRTLLLEIVRHGKLSDCLEATLRVASSSSESETVRSYAVAAIRDMGDQESKRRLAEAARNLKRIGENLWSRLIEATYPESIDAQGLADLLRKVQIERSDHTSTSWSLKNHLEKNLPDDHVADVLYEFVNLVQEPPHIFHDGQEISLSARFLWFGEVMIVPLVRLLRRKRLTDREVRIAAAALQLMGLFQKYNQYHSLDQLALTEINEALLGHPDVRRFFALRRIEEFINQKSHENLRPHHIYDYYVIAKQKEADIDWLVMEISTTQNPIVKRTALLLSIGLWRMFGRKRKIWRVIAKAVKADPDLSKVLKLEARRGPRLWLKGQWFRFWYLPFGRKVRNIPKKLREYYRNTRDQIWLWRNIGKLREGTAISAISELLFEAEQSNHHGHLSIPTLEPLVAKRGRRIAQAVADGCKKLWPLFEPLLPFEKKKLNEIDNRVIIGLNGISFGLLDGDLKLDSLTEREARLACAYALNDFNGFPDWLPELVRYHPNTVNQVVSRCIQGEWDTPPEREHGGETLYDLRYHDNYMVPLVGDVIIEQLCTSDPLNYKVLESALAILLNLPEAPIRKIRELAGQRAPLYFDANQSFFTLWMAVWLQLEADSAITYLQDVITTHSQASETVVKICSALNPRHGQRHPMIPDPDYGRPGCLRRLIPFVFNYVRVEEDIDRSGGGAYTPTPRDYAQEFRNSLFARLSRNPGREAGVVLLELAKQERFEGLHDLIIHLYQQHIEADAETIPWQPKDVRLFAKEYETEPHSDHDLYKIALRRLSNIKDEVERGDISSRYDLHQDDQEMRLRSWLARRLRDLSRGRYNVPQEEEIDLGQRPDLRIEAPGMRPISIELKWADKWTLNELRLGLLNQLVGQYLRAPNSNYGIYILGYKGKKTWWENQDSGQRLTFPDILKDLREQATAILRDRYDIDGLEVIGINFSEPT